MIAQLRPQSQASFTRKQNNKIPGRHAIESPQPGFCSMRQQTQKTNQATQKQQNQQQQNQAQDQKLLQ